MIPILIPISPSKSGEMEAVLDYHKEMIDLVEVLYQENPAIRMLLYMFLSDSLTRYFNGHFPKI